MTLTRTLTILPRTMINDEEDSLDDLMFLRAVTT